MYIRKIIIAVALLGLIAMGAFAYYVYTTVFTPNTRFDTSQAFVFIPTNADAHDLQNAVKPYIKDWDSFIAVANRKGYFSNIKPGRYQLTKGMNNNDIVNTLRSQNLPLSVSFNNQKTIHHLAGRIAQQIEADSTSLVHTMLDASYLSAKQFTADNALAMYIPNTYEFYWNTSAEKFKERMWKEYQAFWNDSRKQKAAALNLTELEVISLAAIVQKETAIVAERPRVAGVYVNRLKRGMLLQADPTVIYTIKKEKNDFDLVVKRVLYKDLEIDSPYNTYKYTGVPPGPIAMPDISSIDAVLNYEQHNYFYFVANPDNPGHHIFAKTLAQHNRNKQKYIRWVNQQRIMR